MTEPREPETPPETPLETPHDPAPDPPKRARRDGPVLFDPTPWQPPEPVGRTPPPGPLGGRALALVLLVLATAGGGYLVFRSGAFSAAQADAPPVEVPIAAAKPDGPVTLSALRREMQGRAGASVPLEVRARDPRSAPVVDSLVRFQVVSGGGVTSPDTARTDTDGVARTTLRLPRQSGTVIVTARLGESDEEVRLEVTVRAGVPARVVAGDGGGQQAEVGELLPVRLAIVVYDEAGVPVPDAEVRFWVTAGGGLAAPARTRTDASGVASALWRLGHEAGSQQLAAAASGVDLPVTFTATAVGRPVAGDGNPLPIEVGPVTVAAREFVVGGSHVCVLVNTAPRCRGANDRDQSGTREARGFVALASGISHVCGLTEVGEALCWGANEAGQLGDGSRSDRPSPAPVRADLRFSSLTAGATHTCGLAGGGTPVCWGQNLNGQLGDGSRTDARFPRAVGGGVSFRSVVAGWNHTCGITSNGNAMCWGLNSDGQLGDNSRLDRLVPTLVRGSIESLSAGNAHTCGVSDGAVFCWGDNRAGQLGDGTTVGRVQPTRVSGLSPVTQVVAGAVYTCALVVDGRAYCWGQNLHGQLGDGTTTNRSAPVAVEGNLHFQAIYAGGALTCGTTVDGTDYCWGLNQSGQLGDGTRQSRSTPTRVQR